MKTEHIRFFNDEVSYTIRQKKSLRTWLFFSILNEARQPGSINIILCSDEQLYQMNVKYLRHKTYTDTITFNYNDGYQISGDIFISIDRIKENSKTFSRSIRDELHRVIIHGILHLCGYNDKTSAEKKVMTLREDFYLSRRGILQSSEMIVPRETKSVNV